MSQPDEDYFLEASLNDGNECIENVLCKVYLPKSTLDKPYFRFCPTEQQSRKLFKMRKCSFMASIKGPGEDRIVTISSPTVYFSNRNTQYWGPTLQKSTLKGEPWLLKIREIFQAPPKDESTNTTHLTLWVSPNSYLEPTLIRTPTYLGEVKCERTNQIKCPILDHLSINFDIHFKIKNEDDSIKLIPHLVATAEIDSIESDYPVNETMIKEVDLLLHIVSLCSRTKTTCLGWETSNNHSHTRYYRCDYNFPTGESELIINAAFPEDVKSPTRTFGLVKKHEFQEFLDTCYPSSLAYQSRKTLTSAIVSLVPGNSRTIEESYLSMFANLEALILDFRKMNNLEYIVKDSGEWKAKKAKIKLALKNALKECQYTDEQRRFAYSKLDELNRIPLRDAYNSFCSKHKITTDDLWPLFGDHEIVGLVEIRNKIIHGESISGEHIGTYSKAKSSLSYLLQRALLSILKYPVHKTDVSESALAEGKFRSNLTREEQVSFTNYIRSM